MRILHLADLHIGKKVHGFSMLKEQEQILLQGIKNIILDKQIETVLIAGDIYDTPVPAGQAVALFDAFLSMLSEMQILTFLIPGNHDSAERIAFAGDILKKTGICIAKPVSHEIGDSTIEHFEAEDKFGKIHFYLMPYLHKDEAIQILENTIPDETERNILLAHQFVSRKGTENILSDSEVNSVGGMEEISYERFEKFDYVALGHLHAGQRIGTDTIRYAGSILKYSFSEAEQRKQYVVIDVQEKGNIQMEFLDIKPIHDMRIIRGPIEKLLEREVYEAEDANDYLWVTLTDEEEVFDALGRLKEVYPNLLRLDFDNSRTRAVQEAQIVENIEKKSILELFEEFYENRTEVKLTSEEKQIVTAQIRAGGFGGRE